MSLIVSGIPLPLEVDENDAIRLAADTCGFSLTDLTEAHIYRKSIDARRGTIRMVYSVELSADGVDETALAEKLRDKGIRQRMPIALSDLLQPYTIPAHAPRPVVVGFGPAGIFSALVLARAGLRPIVLERGAPLSERDHSVHRFHSERILDASSNIQFGEGGAGAYSDGKLTTRIHDPLCDIVLQEFVQHGAPKEILCHAHPHVGTDLLKNVVQSMRTEICAAGGEVHFHTCVQDVQIHNQRLAAVKTNQGVFPASQVVLATGHSARDTFEMLLHRGFDVIAKSFAVGVRIEHLQSEIDQSLFGRYAGDPRLGAAAYSVSHREANRGCFSFCMCPGGYVTASSSEAGTVVTNGMSYHARNGVNGNSALAVSLDASMFGDDPLGGVRLAQQLERRAYALGGRDYTAPAQLVGDFLQGRPSKKLGHVHPTYPMGVQLCSIDEFLPAGGSDLLRTSLQRFAQQHRFFADRDAVLTAPETRTSSPVRICRGKDLTANGIAGLYPCGEGAGYAGGIMSAAVDGIKTACAILQSIS